MAALLRDITIDQGARFAESYILYTDDAQSIRRDLTGWTVRMQIRVTPNAPTTIWDSASPGSGSAISIASPASNGQINLVIGATITAAFPSGQQLKYDIEIAQTGDPNVVVRIMQGVAIVRPNVTR